MIYIFYSVVAFLVNAFGTSILPYVTKGAFIWSMLGFAIISITLLACSSPTFNTGDFVFRLFLNETGWPDGIAWLLGLLQGSLALTGFDAVSVLRPCSDNECLAQFEKPVLFWLLQHMVSRVPNPRQAEDTDHSRTGSPHDRGNSQSV